MPFSWPNDWHPQRDSNPCFRLERAMSSAAGRWGPDPKAEATKREAKISGAGLHSGGAFAGEQPLTAVGSIAHFDPGLGETFPHEVGVSETTVLSRRVPDLQERFHERPDDLREGRERRPRTTGRAPR